VVFGSGCRPRRGSRGGSRGRLRRAMLIKRMFFFSMCCSIGAAGSGLVHEHTTLGSRPAPGTPSAKRSVGTRRAASMQDTLSEGTARAAQLAPSAVTASAVGGSATRRVVGRVSPTTSGSSRSTRDRAAWRSRSSSERLGQPHFWWQILRLRWR